MAFLNSLNISGSALTAQKLRMQVTAQNLANADTTVTEEGGPYRRKTVILAERRIPSESYKYGKVEKEIKSFGGVMAVAIREDEEGFLLQYDPDNPNADAQGYVRRPGINTTEEMIEMIAASRQYEANITVFNAVKSMASKALEIGK
jgi:flagellar basal-body rod protein FlgC